MCMWFEKLFYFFNVCVEHFEKKRLDSWSAYIFLRLLDRHNNLIILTTLIFARITHKRRSIFFFVFFESIPPLVYFRAIPYTSSLF